MKAFSLSLICFAAVVSFASCGKDKNNDSTNTGSSSLEAVYMDSVYQFVGVAKDPTGDLMFVDYPRWSGPFRFGMVRATGMSTNVPFPDSLTNTWLGGQDGEDNWVCPQSVYFDAGGALWVLDPAAPNMGTVHMQNYKLVRINKTTGAWERKYEFDGVASDTSYINDIRIDATRQYAYLTNSKEGGIVVVNLASGDMRQVLLRHPSTLSDTAFRFVIDGKELSKNGKPVKINSDGLALTPDGDWLYYKPLTDDKLYRIRTEYLRDAGMSAAELSSKVEDLGHKCTTDGMIFDAQGRLYLGDLINSRIVRIDPANGHAMTTLVEDQDRLIWPDSYSIAGGYLYITCSQIHKQPDYNNGANRRTTPYMIWRMKI